MPFGFIRNDSMDMSVADLARSRSLSIMALLVCSTISWMGRDWGVLFSRLTADCCGIFVMCTGAGGGVDWVSCCMEAVVGKTASIDLVDGVPRVGGGVGGARFAC